MAVLITAGTGSTGLALAEELKKTNTPYILTSRRGASAAPAGSESITVKFDMADASTYGNPFDHGEKITAIYLIAPEVADPVSALNSFVDYAISRGVRRFVHMTSNFVTKGGPYTGKTWQHLSDKGVEFSVLKATWFTDNLANPKKHLLKSIREKGELATATGDGRIPFVTARDIARTAATLLTQAAAPAEESYEVTGPELLTYDDVARILSEVLGKEVKHLKVDRETTKQQYLATSGGNEGYASMISALEAQAATGTQELDTTAVEKVTGRRGQTVKDFVIENKSVWE